MSIDSDENSERRIASYKPSAVAREEAIRQAERLPAHVDESGPVFRRAVSKVFDAIRVTDRLTGTAYDDAPLRYSHEVWSAAHKLMTETLKERWARVRKKRRPSYVGFTLDDAKKRLAEEKTLSAIRRRSR